MRLARHPAVVIVLALSAPFGCGKHDSGGSGDESSSGGSSSGGTSIGGSMTSTTGAADTSTGAAETSTGGDSTTAPSEVTIQGVVQDLAIGMPINAAEISLVDMPGFSTVSDQNGHYRLDPLPPGAEVFVDIGSNANYFGSIIGLTVPDSDEDDQTLAQISRQTVTDQIGFLDGMNPEPADLMQSIVIVRLLQNLATGTTVTFEPAPLPGTFYAPDENGVPVLNQNVVEFGFLPVVVYYNVAPSAAGDITISAEHPERTCTVVHPAFPTFSEYVTLVDVDCPTN